jgi:uncharacterized protein YndB with AHSA1/START domain
MRENKILIVIDKPVKEVFEFTTNPKNTPLWISYRLAPRILRGLARPADELAHLFL